MLPFIRPHCVIVRASQAGEAFRGIHFYDGPSVRTSSISRAARLIALVCPAAGHAAKWGNLGERYEAPRGDSPFRP